MSRFTVRSNDPVLSRLGKIVGSILGALAITAIIDKVQRKKPSEVAGEETDHDPIVATFKKWLNHHD
jgi:hypothetical protein